MEPQTYRSEIENWRAAMERGLRAPDGWLSLIGLFWLEEGDNTIGAAPNSVVALPNDRAPAYVGSFVREGDTVRLHSDDQMLLVNGATPSDTPLRTDRSGNPDIITHGDVSMFVIERGDRFAVRARDPHNPAREAFAGRVWYPIDESYRVTATFISHATPTTLPIMTILDTVEQRVSPGTLHFTLAGQQHSLITLTENDQLFILFRDLTSGDTTYPAGRYLKAPLPNGDNVILDFNRAYSPPCAFTSFATCPLPPLQNRLLLRVEAGEQYH